VEVFFKNTIEWNFWIRLCDLDQYVVYLLVESTESCTEAIVKCLMLEFFCLSLFVSQRSKNQHQKWRMSFDSEYLIYTDTRYHSWPWGGLAIVSSSWVDESGAGGGCKITRIRRQRGYLRNK
jgi:hypothetical protein